MSILEEKIAAYNLQAKEDSCNAALAHMVELEAVRIANDKTVQQSTKAAWEHLRAKRHKNRDLHRLLPVHLQ